MSYNTPLVEQMVANGAVASRESNDALYPQVAAGNQEAIKKMIESNMSLVIDKVDSYIRCWSEIAYLRDDMISEGFLGLTVAVQRMATKGEASNPNPTGYMSYWINYHIGSTVDKERAVGVGDRTVRRRQQDGDELPTSVPLPDTFNKDEGVDPMSQVDLQDLIESCCETEFDRVIVEMKAKRYSDKEIAATLDIPHTTTYMMRRAIYARFLEKSGLKGEV